MFFALALWGCSSPPPPPTLLDDSFAAPRALGTVDALPSGMRIEQMNHELTRWAGRRSMNHLKADQAMLSVTAESPEIKRAFETLHTASFQLRGGPEPFYKALRGFETELHKVDVPLRYQVVGALTPAAVNFKLQYYQSLGRVAAKVHEQKQYVHLVWRADRPQPKKTSLWTTQGVSEAILHAERIPSVTLDFGWPLFAESSPAREQLAGLLRPEEVTILTETANAHLVLQQSSCTLLDDAPWFGLSRQAWERTQASPPCPDYAEIVAASEKLATTRGLRKALDHLGGALAWTIAAEALSAQVLCPDCEPSRARVVGALSALLAPQIGEVQAARHCSQRQRFCEEDRALDASLKLHKALDFRALGIEWTPPKSPVDEDAPPPEPVDLNLRMLPTELEVSVTGYAWSQGTASAR